MAISSGGNQRRYHVGRHRAPEARGETTLEIPPKSPLPSIGEVQTLQLSAETVAAVRAVVEAHR